MISEIPASWVPRIDIRPMHVTVSGPNADARPSEGFCVAILDDSQIHPAKRLVRLAYGPNVPTALATLRTVIAQDYWLTDGVKCAASDAIDARQEILL